MTAGRKIIKIITILLGVLLLYGTGIAVRRLVLEAQFRAEGNDLPFTLESALNFRRIE